MVAWCRSRCGIGRRDVELRCVIAIECALPREELHQNQGERENVGPRAGGTALFVELLGRSISRREGAGVFLCRYRREICVVSEHFRDAEIEDLHRPAAVDLGHENVLRLDVAVRDFLSVRDRERIGRRLKQLEGFIEREPRATRATALREELREGVTFEPLKHEVRHPLAVRRDHGSDVERLHDGVRLL